MRSLGRISSGKVAAAVTLAAVLALSYSVGGSMFSPGPLKAEGRAKGKPGGMRSHAEIDSCAACHAPPWSSDTMAARCVNCHTAIGEQLAAHGPLHGKLADGKECRTCHTEHKGAHADLTNLALFDHDSAAFPLTGKHVAVDCKSCHKSETFQGAAQTCAGCHNDPPEHKTKGFGGNCTQCHSTNAWHDVGSRGNFNHDLAAFKLTGKHRTVACKSCHTTESYQGTAQTCAACHHEPQNHQKQGFGSNCTQCHTTETWKDSTFKHKFPLTHGRRSRTALECATCHTTATNFKAYTCYGCHEHEEQRMVRKHKRVTNLATCARCHPTGREHERGLLDVPGDVLGQLCPAGDDFLARRDDGASLHCPRAEEPLFGDFVRSRSALDALPDSKRDLQLEIR